MTGPVVRITIRNGSSDLNVLYLQSAASTNLARQMQDNNNYSNYCRQFDKKRYKTEEQHTQQCQHFCQQV